MMQSLRRSFRWLLYGDAAVTVQMDFVIRIHGRKYPDSYRSPGPIGRELSCYIPPGFSWRQICYGQHEGQAEIEGREWGFYTWEDEELHVVLQCGRIEISEALKFVEKVAQYVAAPDHKFDIFVNAHTYTSIKHRSSPLPELL